MNAAGLAALAYADIGLAVFPLAARAKIPPKNFHWREEATTDPERISVEWRRYPQANIGIALTHHFVVDLDGPEGRKSMLALIDGCGPLTPAAPPPRTMTPRGYHLWFSQPADGRIVRNDQQGTVGDHVDIRGVGGYVVAPPSRTTDIYRFSPGRSLLEIAAPQAPEWLLALAYKAPQAEEAAAAPAMPIDGEWGPSPGYSRTALDRAAREIVAAPPGRQELTLSGEAYSIGQLVAAGVMPRSFARNVLVWAGSLMQNGDARRPWLRTEIERKVDRAFTRAAARPRTVSGRPAK